MGGSASEVFPEVDNNEIVPLIQAGNLVVAVKWRETGIGSSLSHALKVFDFARSSEAIVVADNVDKTRNIWEKLYGSHVVATTGWFAIVKN